MSEKGNQGGARPGAGRPKSAVRKVNLTVSLPPANKARIDAKAKANGVSSSELVKRWSDRLPNAIGEARADNAMSPHDQTL